MQHNSGPHLTRRERQIAALIAQGRLNREIATALGISYLTVQDEVHALLQKLGLRNRTELSSYWWQHFGRDAETGPQNP